MTGSRPFPRPSPAEKVTPDLRARLPALSAVTIWIGIIAICTLQPLPESDLPSHKAVPWDCLVCGDGGATDVFLNFLLFIPFGLLLERAKVSRLRAIVYGLTLSTAIELIQAGWLAGRDATLSDVLFNSLGASTGWFVAHAFFNSARHFSERARSFSLGFLVLNFVVWFGTAWGMHPSLTGPTPWWGYYVQFSPEDSLVYGDMLSANYQNTAVSPIKYARFPFLPGGDSLQIMLSPVGEIPDGKLPRLRIKQADSGQIVTIDQAGSDLILGLRTRLTKYRFRTPGVVFKNAVRISESPHEFRWRWSGAKIVMTASGAGSPDDTVHDEHQFSVTNGWALIHPFVTRLNASAPTWSLLWIVWWFGALGALAAWCTRRAQIVFGVAAFSTLVGAGIYADWPVTTAQMMTAALAYVGMLMAMKKLKNRS